MPLQRAPANRVAVLETHGHGTFGLGLTQARKADLAEYLESPG